MPTATRSKKAFDYNLVASDVRRPLREAAKKTGLPEETVIKLCVHRFLHEENAGLMASRGEWTVLAVAEDAIDWTVPIGLIVDHLGQPYFVGGARGVCNGLSREQLEGWLKTGQQPLNEDGRRVTRELKSMPTGWDEAIEWWRSVEKFGTLQTPEPWVALVAYRRYLDSHKSSRKAARGAK